jgi:hypothetical protein
MAQETSKSGRKSGTASKRGSASGGGRSTSSRSRSSSNGASAKSGSRTASRTRRPPSSRASSGAARKVSSGAQSTRGTVANSAQSAGHAIGTAASKAKGPAIAGGAAIAGLVGGMTIASRRGRRRVLGVPVPGAQRPLLKVKRPARVNTTRNLMKAAGHMGNAGRQMAELATEVRLAREQMGANGRRRSPVEVVLDGLTARR